MRKLRKPTSGTILRIPLEEGFHTYARYLRDPYVAFHDHRTKEEIADLAPVIRAPVLFVIAIGHHAERDPRWRRVGRVPLEPHERVIPDRWIQDPIDPRDLRILSVGFDGEWSERPATLEECERLECAAVWEFEGIERRLNDHYAGRPNVSLLADQLIYPGQVFSIVLYRESPDPGFFIASGRVHGEIAVGDRLASARGRSPNLTVINIETYQRDGVESMLVPGQSGTLHLSGDITPDVRSAISLFK